MTTPHGTETLTGEAVLWGRSRRSGRPGAVIRARGRPIRHDAARERRNVRASPLPQRTVLPSGYAEYIRSPAWQEVRRRFWASKLPKDCYCCGRADGPKDLHHRTYKNLGRENLRDLVPLCRDCHGRVHELQRRKTLGLWGATNIVRRERHPVYGRKGSRKAAAGPDRE